MGAGGAIFPRKKEREWIHTVIARTPHILSPSMGSAISKNSSVL